MIRFKDFLRERYLSIGLNPKHEPYREKYRETIAHILRKSYEGIGGYGGLTPGSKEESDAIHKDISDHMIKAVKRGDSISSVRIYKDSHGRKSIAAGTDGSVQGKKDFRAIGLDDMKKQRSWGEVSGAPEIIARKQGMPVIPSSQAEKLLGKKVDIEDAERYTRNIGGHPKSKVIVGYPKT